jgi:hypothetical protein
VGQEVGGVDDLKCWRSRVKDILGPSGCCVTTRQLGDASPSPSGREKAGMLQMSPTFCQVAKGMLEGLTAVMQK